MPNPKIVATPNTPASEVEAMVQREQDHRVRFDQLTPSQQANAVAQYRAETGDTDTIETVLLAVMFDIDWDSETGKPWTSPMSA